MNKGEFAKMLFSYKPLLVCTHFCKDTTKSSISQNYVLEAHALAHNRPTQ